MTITQTIEIPESRRVILNVPSEIPTGKANIVIFPVREKTTVEQAEAEKTEELPKRRELVYHTGKFWMADDFNEPLEDFKDYM